ncbi:MAG TPA: DUF4240 domain-containing protein [Thermoanaerobaculia bacterium]
MDKQQFWAVIEESRRALKPDEPEGNNELQIERLEKILSRFSPEEVIGFRDAFDERLAEAFRWDFWGVAYILGEGCSDDYFEYFRRWLVSMGRDVFDEAMRNPESIESAASRGDVEDIFFEDITHVADDVYRRKTGRDMPESAVPFPDEPKGQRWRTDDDLRAMFPALSQRH